MRHAWVPEGIWGDRRISNAQFRCLVCLLGYADKDGYCYPSVRTIARDLSRTRSTIRHHLNALVELGVITRDPMPRKDGSRGSNRYCVARLRCVSPDLRTPDSPAPAEQPAAAAATDRQPMRRPDRATAEQPALLLPLNGGQRPEPEISSRPARRDRERHSPNLIAQTALAVMRNG
jgi:GntR family transcriptional regulator